MVQSLHLLALHEVRGMVVAVAAQEHEEVADGIRPSKSEQVLVERLHRHEVGDERSDVAEFGGPKRGVTVYAAQFLPSVEVQRGVGVRLSEDEHVRGGRGDVGATLDPVTGLAEPAFGVTDLLPELVPDEAPGVVRARGDDDAG